MHRRQEHRPQIDNDQVGLLPRFDRPGELGCAEGPRTAAAGHLETVLGLQRHGVEMMDLLEQHGRLQHLEEVLAIVAPRTVAGQGNGDSSRPHVEDARHTRSEVHVAHRAVHDGGAPPGDQIQLVVVQPHAMGELQVGPENAEVLEPFDMARAPFLEVHVDLHRGLGAVDVGSGPPRPRLGDRRPHRLVRASPRDERRQFDPDAVVVVTVPPVTEPTGALDHSVGRLHQERLVVAVGPAASEQEANPDLIGGRAHAVIDRLVDVDVLVVDHRGCAGTEILDQADGGRQPGRIVVEMHGAGQDAVL